MSLKSVYIFRHGETDWNRALRMQGHTDIPLNNLGNEQAKALAEFFKNHPVDVVLSSDLLRAQETARAVAVQNNAQMILDPGLRETNLGDAEGLTEAEINQAFGMDAMARWRSAAPENYDFSFPGGESRRQHLSRILTSIEGFLNKTQYERIAISTHGGSIWRLITHIRPDATEGLHVPNCSVFHFEYNAKSHKWKMPLKQALHPIVLKA